MGDEALRLDNQLCFLLYGASRAVTQIYGPLLAPLGVTYPQYLVLLVLWETDGASVRTLCERLYLDSGTLTPLRHPPRELPAWSAAPARPKTRASSTCTSPPPASA